MSGFAGLLSMEGRPVEPAALDSVVRFLEARGPDGTNVRALGPIVLGHTFLRTGPPHRRESLPVTIDGDAWIVGDLRIDAQAELIAALEAAGRIVRRDVTDAELVLHAYAAWGEACPEHLFGDFAFAIWDAPKRTLFCVRDQMGIKPFFHARMKGGFLFGNTLASLRLHPDVPADLNELAIADFLMFGCNLDLSASAFKAINRLPPAHSLTIANGGVRERRYWTMPVDEPLRFARSSDYVDRFRELLTVAVADRMRTDRVAIFMSGGLDSTLLAAEAKAQSRGAVAISAYTYLHERRRPDPERHFAGLVAHHLDIPIRLWVTDSDLEVETAAPPGICTPEPVGDTVTIGAEVQRYREMASFARVAFYGEGPDNALHYEWRPYLAHLLGRRQYSQMLTDVVAHVAAHRRVPLVPTIPAMFRASKARENWDLEFPTWLNDGLVRRLDLRARWCNGYPEPPAVHPVRPSGYRSLHLPQWARLLDSLDAGRTHAHLDVRHPYLDLRLLRYFLALPAMPWCRVKYLLREAGKGVLPAATLARPKSTLPMISEAPPTSGWRSELSAHANAAMYEFVDFSRLTLASAAPAERVVNVTTRIPALARWLREGVPIPRVFP
jgi:asparagine synthase (glutamine-hydrolysing)